MKTPTASWIAGILKFESSQIIKLPEKLQVDPVAELERCISFVRFHRLGFCMGARTQDRSGAARQGKGKFQHPVKKIVGKTTRIVESAEDEQQ